MNLLDGTIAETGAQTLVDLVGGGRAVSAIATSPEDKGRRVRVGVRPEDMRRDGGAPIFTGTVHFTELLGEVTQLYFQPQDGRDPVIAKLPGIVHNLRGNEVTLSADPAQVHLFADGLSMRAKT